MKHPIGLVVCCTNFVVMSTGFDSTTPFLFVPFQPAFLVKEGFPSALDFLPPSVLDLCMVLMAQPILKSTKQSTTAIVAGRSRTPCLMSSVYAHPCNPNMKLNILSSSHMFMISNIRELKSFTYSLTEHVCLSRFKDSFASHVALESRT